MRRWFFVPFLLLLLPSHVFCARGPLPSQKPQQQQSPQARIQDGGKTMEVISKRDRKVIADMEFLAVLELLEDMELLESLEDEK